MKHSVAIYSLLALATASSASAQDLNRTITVDRTIVPVERAASRMSEVHPNITSLPIQQTSLRFAEYLLPSELTSRLSFLEPAAWGDTIPQSPYKYYASIGYLPVYNLEANAGGRFIDNKTLQVGAWMQYNGNSYKAQLFDTYKPTFANHNLSIGTDASYNFEGVGRISADMRFMFGSNTQPFHRYDRDLKQKAIDFAANVGWNGSIGAAINYYASLGYEHFGFANTTPRVANENIMAYILSPVKENSVSFALGAKWFWDEMSQISLNIDGRMNHYSSIHRDFLDSNGTTWYWINETPADIPHHPTEIPLPTVPCFSYGVTHIRPAYDRAFGVLDLHAGVNLSVISGRVSPHLRIAPDVRVEVTPSSQFAAYLHLDGGVFTNSLRSLYDQSPYTPAWMQPQPTNIPLEIKAGANFGPFSGVTIKAFGGYSFVRGFFMPVNLVEDLSNFTQTDYLVTDYDGWHLGLNLAYSYRKLASVSFTAETARQGFAKGYYRWVDGAKYALEAAVKLTPLPKLEVDLSYRLRALRRGYNYRFAPIDGHYVVEFDTYNLGNISHLNIGGIYRLTDRFSVFLQLDNLLNHRAKMLFGMPEQGIHGLAGITLKF